MKKYSFLNYLSFVVLRFPFRVVLLLWALLANAERIKSEESADCEIKSFESADCDVDCDVDYILFILSI